MVSGWSTLDKLQYENCSNDQLYLCTHISNRLLPKIVPVFYLIMSWLYVSEKKTKKEKPGNCNSVGAGTHKEEKVFRFWPKFDPNFI